MKKLIHFYLLGAIAVFCSCKAMRNVARNDNSTSVQSKPVADEKDAVFLDNINITPGAKRTVVSKSSATNKTYGTPVKAVDKDFDLENASPIQLKYATILDVPVEDLANINLLADIDYWWGTKYCLGGTSENCIDCSAFTQNLILDVYDINIPRTAKEQYENSKRIKKDDLREGDLVFFQTSRRGISHVGVYLANNKFVHASASSGVTISDLTEDYWKKRYRAAGRVLN